MKIDKKELQDFLDHGSEFKHITYETKMDKSLEELMATDPTKIIKRGWEERDKLLGGIFGGKLYLIGAETGTGKSTFVNQICNNVSSQGHRVVKYSLEDRMEDIGKEELFYEANRLLRKEKKVKFEWAKFVCNEYTGTIMEKNFVEFVSMAYENLKKKKIIELEKQRDVKIEDLTRLMEEEARKGTTLFAIDHLHYFEFDKGDRLDLQIKNVMHRINEIARKHNVAVVLVAHYKNNTGRKEGMKPDPTYFKDASAIKQVANVIVQITREESEDGEEEVSKFYITKLRGPIQKRCFETRFDLAMYEYDFKRSDTSKKKELSTQR